MATTPSHGGSPAPRLRLPVVMRNIRYYNARMRIYGGFVFVSEDDAGDVDGTLQGANLRVSFFMTTLTLQPPGSSTRRRYYRRTYLDFPLSQLNRIRGMAPDVVFARPAGGHIYANFCFGMLGFFANMQARRLIVSRGRTPRTVMMQIDVGMVIDETSPEPPRPPPRQPGPVPQLEMVVYEAGAAAAAGVGERACPICLADFRTGEEVGKTPCGHPFHPACLVQWLERKPLCPICRTRIPLLSDSDHAPAVHRTG